MKKKVTFILSIFILILFPFIANAANISLSVSCRDVVVGTPTSCDVYATPSNGIQAIQGTYSLAGNNVSITNVVSGDFSGTVGSGAFNFYGDIFNGRVKLFTVNMNTTSAGTSKLNVHVNYFTAGDDQDYTAGYNGSGTITVTAPTTTTTKPTTTRPPATGGTQATMNTTTQPVETTTKSILYLESLTVGDFEVREEDGVYYVTTDIQTDSVEIAATAPEGVQITGLGKRNLNFGKNTINLGLSLPDGQARNIQVIITRPDVSDKNTLLKELEVINYKLDFDPKTMEYTVTVPYNVKDVYIYAVAQSADTSIKGNGKFSLGGSETNAFVTVSYGDVASSTYTIHIKKSYIGLLPIILLTIGLIGTTGGLFFLSNKLNETKEAMNNKMIADRANFERAIEDQGPQLSINGESATGIGARVVKPQSVQPQNIKVVQSRPTTTVGIVPPSQEEINNVPTMPNPQVKVVKKVVKSVNTGTTIKQIDTHTSEV